MRGARLVPLILDCVAYMGHTETVEALIAADANTNAVITGDYRKGETPLHRAALSTRARGSLQPSAAPHARRCSARTAREAAH